MFFVAKICKRALRASIEGYLVVSASTPTSATLDYVHCTNAHIHFLFLNVPSASEKVSQVLRYNSIEKLSGDGQSSDPAPKGLYWEILP